MNDVFTIYTYFTLFNWIDVFVALVMLDLSAAFDSVSHGTPLQCLEQDFGVKGSALLWMQSYFEGCTQAVKINDTISIPLPLTVGMPQGS